MFSDSFFSKVYFTTPTVACTTYQLVRRYRIIEELNILIMRRDQIKTSLTRFQNYIRSLECDINQISHRRRKTEVAWENFKRVQTDIEELDAANGTDHLSTEYTSKTYIFKR